MWQGAATMVKTTTDPPPFPPILCSRRANRAHIRNPLICLNKRDVRHAVHPAKIAMICNDAR